MWVAIGQKMQRGDVVAHGEELLQLAPLIQQQLQASLNKTVRTVGAVRCWAQTTETAPAPPSTYMQGTHGGGLVSAPPPAPLSFRGYSEMLFSGALTKQQVMEIYTAASESICGPRLLVLGSPAIGTAPTPTPPPPPARCNPMPHVDYMDPNITTVPCTAPNDCCDLCAAHTGCAISVYSPQGKTCTLKSSARNKVAVKYGSVALSAIPPPPPRPSPPAPATGPSGDATTLDTVTPYGFAYVDS